MKVLVRADASSSIGIGHTARCLTLAQVLPDNQASLQLFASAGFVQSPCSFERVFQE